MWQPIATAPNDRYIIVATQYAAGKWLVNYVFRENDEWVDVHSDKVVRPHVWAPEPPEQSAADIEAARKRFS